MVTSRHLEIRPAAAAAAPSRPADLLSAAVAVVAVALGFLVGRDGSPAWQVVRVLVVAALASVSAYAFRRAPRRARGPLAFVLGVVATAAGAGIGLPHLSKAGWSPVTAAGLVTLAAGAVLLVTGTAMIARQTPRWWRLPALAAVLAITAVSLWSGIQAVAATNVPPTAVRSATPADRGLTYRDVTFPTADGVRLSGWYLPSAGRPAVVLLHGAGSTRSDVLDHAVVLARHRYGVLLFDARGHGRSGGRAMDFGWYGDRDIAAAVSFLQARPDVDARRIALVGMSMGGEQAIGAAATDTRIRAVVAEGATNRVTEDWAFLPETYGVRGAIQQRINALTYGVADLLTSADPPIALRSAARAAAPRPMLLITAGEVADEAYAARLIQNGNRNVQVWQVPGTGHTKALSTHPGEWEQNVTNFLAAALTTS
jgi:pimeloyl-ACP methyl ester carboxylesterase